MRIEVGNESKFEDKYNQKSKVATDQWAKRWANVNKVKEN